MLLTKSGSVKYRDEFLAGYLESMTMDRFLNNVAQTRKELYLLSGWR